MAGKRRKFSAEEKVRILRRHLIDKVPVSDLCDEQGLHLVALLTGEVDMIIEGFRIAAEDDSLSASKVETLRSKVLGYFFYNRNRMQYDKYFAVVPPIGSGIIEGTRRDLINDRMER